VRYGREAERLYYAKFPGGASPLLSQLHAQRDDYLLRVENRVRLEDQGIYTHGEGKGGEGEYAWEDQGIGPSEFGDSEYSESVPPGTDEKNGVGHFRGEHKSHHELKDNMDNTNRCHR
jgi:hypothetical protein